ncbi:MAG: hypothetical protein GWN79_25340, partial [Actinobacteria bacterium]|nr:hypothetical protein [Actinomycetota bacterium]NIT98547.1 hypothetical protein [Actinomycetota bacterium]NIU22174.1 hypothetical protein [Actinomycetota bacterium]NIU70709.1 hypothetical protein [Actinomycetota bacterium]NIV90296.1 hypothetical protein [Actinomycetota bacterium]
VGVSVGAIGRMTTAAYPTGRARFSEGECDVQAQQGTLEAGTRVVVRRVDGPIVFVAAEAEARGG